MSINRISVHTKNVGHRIGFLNFLLKKGYLWHGDPKYKYGTDVEMRYSFERYPIVSFHTDTKYVAGNESIPGGESATSVIVAYNKVNDGMVE